MAKQKIVWTVLPYGFEAEAAEHRGSLRASIVVSPRLTPEAADEQNLGAFPDFLDWPARVVGLEPVLLFEDAGGVTHKIPAKLLGRASSARWKDLFPATTFVEGFQFADFSQVNLRSYSVRNVMKFVRRNYEKLATNAGTRRPQLLPWRSADPTLKGLLSDLGVATRSVVLGDRRLELPGPPGFDRFMDFDSREGAEALLRRRVFSKEGLPPGELDLSIPGVDGRPSPWPHAMRALPADFDPKLDAGFRTPAEYDFYQANRFYTRPENRSAHKPARPDLKNVDPPPAAPEFDFHRIVASFADYPSLMRELGLVIDVVLPGEPSANALLAALLASADGRVDGAISLLPQGGGSQADAFPRTALRLTRGRFVTRSRTTEIADGMLALAGASDRYDHTKSHYDVYQVDPDGAAMKTVHFLLSAQRLVGGSVHPVGDGKITYSTGDRQGVAALRSGSIGVSHHGRARSVAIQAASTSLKNSALAASAAKSTEVLLCAEDVLRGYRVDVLPASAGRWNSLCRRVGTYRVLNLTHAGDQPDYAPDEGYVKGPSTTSKEGGDDHYLHESLFRWSGWSLVASRPGRAIVATPDDATALQRERVETVDDVAAKNTGVVVKFRAEPGSLPKLRFGERYRLRARVVDLAGNSLLMSDPTLGDDDEATDEITYLRFEPVDPPALVQRDRLSEGEALERMVIRSNHDAGTAAYRTSAAFSAAIALPESAGFDYPEEAVRHVVPPKSSQLQAEMHGLLDHALSGLPNARAPQARAVYELIHQREKRSMFDVPGIELVTPPAATATSTTLPLQLPTADKPTGDRLTGGQYVVYPDGAPNWTLPTPYLPDDAACGIALRHVPGVTRPMPLGDGAAIVRAPNEELVLLVVFSGKWPERTGLRIVVRELAATIDPTTCDETPAQDPTPAWNAATRELTLFVPKGRIERLQYSSFVFGRDLAQYGLRPDDPIEYLETLGIPAWVTSAGARRQVEAMASVGANWMITPDRPLVLVHATQQPVCKPKFLALAAGRKLGDTHADLTARLRMHGPSTGKFEILGEWSETVDDPLRGPPERIDGTGQLSEVTVPENFRNAFGLDELIERNLAEAVENLPNAGGPADPKPAKARGDRHEFGDTRFRLVRYRLRATTRFREYFPPSLADDRANITRVGDPVEGVQVDRGLPDDLGAPVLIGAGTGVTDGCIVVPNSAPPGVPSVVYVLPTFLWRRDLGADKAKQSSTRFGNGLRVYLDRPWFSSGDGELLGVVIRGESVKFDAVPPALIPYVTQWGIDPLFDSILPADKTRAADFPLRVASAEVQLQEAENERVTVVGHRVQWDPQRELWYCDIELDAGRNYMPFVRLALVRFQPNSIAGAEISRVVLADFAQLMPRRSIALERAGASIKLAVRGPAPEYGPMKTSRMQTEFIENRSFTGPLLGPPRETGRNRLEVVVQTRNPDIDSDLEWADLRTLASTLLDPPGAGMGAEALPAPTAPSVAGARRRIEPGELFREAAGRRSPGLGLEHAGANLGGILDILQPLLWEGSVTLPELAEQKARLAIREFERFYTDESVDDAAAGRPRRVLGERLVYAEFFPLT